jgi:hypothetical protein
MPPPRPSPRRLRREAVVTDAGSDVVAPLQGRRLAAIRTLSRPQVSFAQGRHWGSSSPSADASNPCCSARYSVRAAGASRRSAVLGSKPPRRWGLAAPPLGRTA